MFRLPNYPSPQADPHELADFAELTCWERGTASKREIVAYLNRLDDNDHNIGCDDDEDENSDILDEVMIEIDRRVKACKGGYPFTLERAGNVLRHKVDDKNHSFTLYRYLLLSTRLNMKDNSFHAEIQGTDLLEEISAQTLKHYLGADRSRTHVFGTAASGGFKSKIDLLCQHLGEGGGYRNLDSSTNAKDDKLDAVAWVPFSDKYAGQLIIFGQCKTGTSWKQMVTQTRPDAFVSKWMRSPLLVTPIRAFCLSEAVDRSQWNNLCIDAGLVFDRCRIVDFCHDVSPDLLSRIERWNSAAKSTVTLLK